MIRATIAGFMAGAGIPISLGIYIIAHEHSYRASLPSDANLGHCGMPILGAWFLILAGPFCGVFGAAIGLASSAIYQLRSNNVPD